MMRQLLLALGALLAAVWSGPAGAQNVSFGPYPIAALPVVQTILPTQAVGTLGVAGIAAAPTLNGNGEGDIYLSAAGGLILQGKGSTDDLRLLNSAGATTCNIATGTTALTCAGLTLSGFTQGSVLFAGASGAISQDNANFFWDATNHRLGIGTASPGVWRVLVSQTDVATGVLFGGTTKGVRIGFDALQTYIEGVDNTGVASYQPIVLDGSIVKFGTNGPTERMRISNAGGVSIGSTTDPGLGNLLINGGVVSVTDASATHFVQLQFNSSSALTADRALTIDVVNAARTLKFGANLTIVTDPGAVSGAIKSNGTGTFTQAGTGDLSDISTFSLNTSGTITTTNATAATSSTTGALKVTGGMSAQGAIWGGTYGAWVGTTLPTPAAGTIAIGGEAAVPTFAANGEAAVFITSTTGGISLMGKGSTNDFTLYNSAGTATCVLPTGTTALSCPGLVVTGSTQPANGIYLPAASTVGVVGASALEFFAGATNELDFAVTTAAIWTSTPGWTFTNAAIKMTGITTGTNADTVCLKADGTLLIQAAACTISSLRFKDVVGEYPRGNALAVVDGLKPIVFTMKPGDTPNRDPNYRHLQAGLSAENVAAVEPLCALYEDDGITPKSYRSECLLAVAMASIQELQREIAELRSSASRPPSSRR